MRSDESLSPGDIQQLSADARELIDKHGAFDHVASINQAFYAKWMRAEDAREEFKSRRDEHARRVIKGLFVPEHHRFVSGLGLAPIGGERH